MLLDALQSLLALVRLMLYTVHRLSMSKKARQF